MTEQTFSLLLNTEIFLSLLVFVLLFFINAPYGRFGRKGWGPSLKSTYAWIIMESPSLLIPLILFCFTTFSVVSLIFLIIWLSHYGHRALIYPFTLSDPKKPFALILLLWGFAFNTLNSVVNFYYLFILRPIGSLDFLMRWQFILGLILFILGYYINKKSDFILRSLRVKNEKSYSIPHGFFFKWISTPNYLGEIIQWGAWGLLTWSISGLAFFLFTTANLFPRALMIHKWYKNNFKDYPQERKAIIPHVI